MSDIEDPALRRGAAAKADKRGRTISQTAGKGGVETQAQIEGLGSKLRNLRRLRGLRMIDVAKAAKCSESLISKIESGRTQPSLNTLHRIAHALEANIAQLFAEQSYSDDTVFRQGQRPILSQGSRGKDIKLERLIPFDASYMLEAYIHHLEVGAGSEGKISHHGEEIGYVIAGEIVIIVDDREYHLNEGDCFHFRSELSHSYRNSGKGEARIIWVNTPPTY